MTGGPALSSGVMDITIGGAGIAGMAAAARLARLGHRVVLASDGEALGGRWAPAPAGDDVGGHVVDAMPQVVRLPATWRDLFKKSGGHLQTELNRAGLELVAAPPARHLLPDGTVLDLPSDRGSRLRAVEHALGSVAADRWGRLTAGLGDLWSAYRRHALEGTAPATTRRERQGLWLDRTLGDLADDLGPGLGALVTSLGPSPRSPGVLAVELHAEQLFGRWQLVDDRGRPQRASRLVDLLAGRLTERGVTVVDDAPGPCDVDTRSPATTRRRWWRPGPAPAPAPRITHALRDASADGSPAGITEVVDHTGPRPVTTWLRPVAEGVLATVHDHRDTRPDPAWGLATTSARDWLGRPPVVGDDHAALRASPASPAGAQPWAELASAALAVYELHERLTGEDSRPTNKDFRPPRLGRG